VGRANAASIREPLRRLGIHVDLVTAYPGESRSCTIVCDRQARVHPTVINEESPPIDDAAATTLLAKVWRWIPHVEAVLTTGSLSTGLPVDFYAQILDCARKRGKLTAIDAAGAVLRVGLQAHPSFMKSNTEEFSQLTRDAAAAPLVTLAAHTVVTFGRAGALLMHEGKCLCAVPPRLFETNPIGAGDAFAAAYLRYMLDRRSAADCLRIAMAAAASDASTLRPGMLDMPQLQHLARQVESRFL
jgi:tagatose 6-phosphate kinase